MCDGRFGGSATKQADGAHSMTHDEIDVDWGQRIAALVVDALVSAGVLPHIESEKASEIAAEEITVRLTIKDRPDRTNFRYSEF